MAKPHKPKTEQANRFHQQVVLQRKPVYEFFKRVLDICFALVSLVLLFVPFIIISIIILIDSPGASPNFVQNRVGKNGKEFKFYKFRSMIPNAEKMLDELLDKNEMDGPVYLRFGRLALPMVTAEEEPFVIGKGQVLRSGTDVTIIASGLPVAIWQETVVKTHLEYLKSVAEQPENLFCLTVDIC